MLNLVVRKVIDGR